MEKLKRSRIAVFGLGGVGSYACEALARSGIGFIRMIDFDKVSLTNINRQLPALMSTVGKNKTDIMKSRLYDINPEISVEVFSEFCARENRERLIESVDYVIDAIDSLNPKVSLIEDLYKAGVELVSSMGAAGRTSPEYIKIGDISETDVCPLAKKVRKMLKRRGIESGIDVVYSNEKPLPSIPRSACLVDNEKPHRGRDRNIQSSICYIPAIMGLWAASHVIRKITGLS